MPYITPQDRKLVDEEIVALVEAAEQIPDLEKNRTGILNYIITTLGLGLLEKRGYGPMKDIRAAMTDAAEEWYRKQMAPYEDEKIEENGDVIYPPRSLCADCEVPLNCERKK